MMCGGDTLGMVLKIPIICIGFDTGSERPDWEELAVGVAMTFLRCKTRERGKCRIKSVQSKCNDFLESEFPPSESAAVAPSDEAGRRLNLSRSSARVRAAVLHHRVPGPQAL